MAEKETTKVQTLEREYIIPLRNEWRKVANYRRTGRAIKFIKEFIAKHMKVPDRDVSKVKLDIYLNQEIFFRGRKKPPAKIKVKAKRDGDLVKVELAELPKHIRFLKQKHEKKHKPSEKTKEAPKEEKKEEKTEEEKKEEKEKEQSVAEQKEQFTEQQTKAQKHTTKVKETKFHRMAMKK